MEHTLLEHIAGRAAGISAYRLFKDLCKGVVSDHSHLQELKDRSFIIASNHVSHLDWLLLHYIFEKKLGRHISFLAKKELFDAGIFGLLMGFSKSIRVDRDNVSKDVIRGIRTAVRWNRVIGIFPEGTRSPDGRLLPLKIGAVRIACSLHLPIVPIGLVGLHRVLPKGAVFPRIHKCEINIGKPILLHDMMDLTLEQKSDLLMLEIARLSRQEPAGRASSP